MRTITNAVGMLLVVTATFVATAAAAVSAPTSRSAPTIDGKVYVGSTLTAGNGLWNNSPTSYSYQWLRCAADGTACANIGGSASKTYTLVKADIGHTIVVLVTATNSGGSSPPTNSKPTNVITPATAPTAATPPAITGDPFVGEQLVADAGTYGGGAVDRYTFQWQRCDTNGGSCTDIAGATAQTYGVLKTDVGHTLRVQVTATNPFGNTASQSKATPVIKAAPTPPAPVTTTITATRQETTCCQTAILSGTVSTNKAGEKITILAQEQDGIVPDVIGTVVTDSSGNWSLTVHPMIQTLYVAQTSTSKTTPLVVKVHPRLGLGVSGNDFSAKVTGRDSFGGAVALFQVQTASGDWKTIQLVVTNLQSVARFHVNLKRGKTYHVRIYLPQRQAGAGYLDGTSHVRRVGGAS